MTTKVATHTKRIYDRPCSKCGGSGTVELEPWLADILRLITVSAKTPEFIADILDLTPQTTNMRLKKLTDYGMVTRKPVPVPGGGKTYLYRKEPHVRARAEV